MLVDLELSDILLSLSYLSVLLLVAYYIRKNHIRQDLKKYFIPFIFFKVLCAILFVIIHIYYYSGGDTFLYFAGGKFISNQFIINPSNFISLYFGDFQDISNLVYSEDFYVVQYLNSPSVLFTCRFTSLLCLLSFNKFLTTSILFSLVTSFGIWCLFKGFCTLNKDATKLFAFGTLFYPTLGIWGSGILKDPLTISAIGIFFYSTINLVQGKKAKSSVLLIIIATITCLSLKPYILYIFIPSILLWVQSTFIKKIKNPLLKVVSIPVILSLFILTGYYIINTISSNAELYSLENLEDVAKGFHSWHTYLAETRGQSGYSLGEINFTIIGVLKTIPAAIFVTFFRPLPFEVNNIALLLECLESMSLLILTLIVLLKIGPLKFIKNSFKNKEVFSYLVFSIFFGATVGLISYNFGALSRYKLPCIPFFIAALAILYNSNSKKINNL